MPDKNENQNPFTGKRFDIEHALNMYASSFVHIPASLLYETEMLEAYSEVIETCHIYFIGYFPRLSLKTPLQRGRTIMLPIEYLGQAKNISWKFPAGVQLRTEADGWFAEDEEGQRYAPTGDQILMQLGRQHSPLEFDVRYIGQSYGTTGSRSALDRLLKHETLQKIALKQPPPGYQIHLLLLAIQPNNRILTVISPQADYRDSNGMRVRSGLDKLYGTNADERISLYEAAMIRYFRPEFNIAFKDSFPSTRLKILQDCYEKDFSAVIAEISFDEMPFLLKSEDVNPAQSHLAFHSLHAEDNRRMFFGF